MRGLFLVAALLTAPAARAQEPIPESPTDTIGYPTVAAALQDLTHRTNFDVSVQGGWTVVQDRANATLWSFAPPNNPAYPAVVRRQLANEGGAVNLHMSVKCEASKAACDQLVRDFQKLNGEMIAAVRGRR